MVSARPMSMRWISDVPYFSWQSTSTLLVTPLVTVTGPEAWQPAVPPSSCVGAILLVVPGLLAAAGALYALRVVGGLAGVPAGAREPERLLLAGVLVIIIGLGAAPRALRGYGHLTRPVLARPGTTELNRRITHL